MAWQEVFFQYDGSFDGFLCCVYESYVHKEFPIAFCSDEECYSLYDIRVINTQMDHARRVYRSIFKRSSSAAQIVRRGFLTCLSDKESYLYAFIQKLFTGDTAFFHNLSDPVYYPLHRALRHMSGELEKLRGFIRFSDFGGVLGAEIEPQNRVLPLLRQHFCNRYANEKFFIYDRTNHDLLMYENGRSKILQVTNFQMADPTEDEQLYRTLWKRFHNTIAIKERYNPRCQNTFMPKRYRSTMTEFLPIAPQTIPTDLHEALQDSGVPVSIPELGIHQ